MAVLALLVSDIHLSQTAPVARSLEPDWLAAQERILKQVKRKIELYEAPLIVAGDIFHRYNPNPELINWACDVLPKCYAIPGQHDLCHHVLADLYKSAYQTLVKAGVIVDLGTTPSKIADRRWKQPKLVVCPFPWGELITPLDKQSIINHYVYLAVVHSYCWSTQSTGYFGASLGQNVVARAEQFRGYSAVQCGDNHHGWMAKSNGIDVLNCGCLIQRRSDERKLTPSVGLLYDDGHIERHFLDTSEDVWLDEDEVAASTKEEAGPELEQFIEEMSKLGLTDSLDFESNVRAFYENPDNRVAPSTREILDWAMEQGVK